MEPISVLWCGILGGVPFQVYANVCRTILETFPRFVCSRNKREKKQQRHKKICKNAFCVTNVVHVACDDMCHSKRSQNSLASVILRQKREN